MQRHIQFAMYLIVNGLLLAYPQISAAHLAPDVGRFMQRDPLEYADEQSLYQYERSAPLAHRDPRGLLPFCLPCVTAPNPDANNGSKLGRIMAKFQNSNCGPLRILACACDALGWPPGRGGSTVYSPANGTIVTICWDRVPNKDAATAHELVHAWDLCTIRNRDGGAGPSFEDLACSEIRAYSYDGSCDNANDRDACIKAGAVNSLVSGTGMPNDIAEGLVGEHFGRCRLPANQDPKPIESPQ
jgi:Peptidase M76 family